MHLMLFVGDCVADGCDHSVRSAFIAPHHKGLFSLGCLQSRIVTASKIVSHHRVAFIMTPLSCVHLNTQTRTGIINNAFTVEFVFVALYCLLV